MFALLDLLVFSLLTLGSHVLGAVIPATLNQLACKAIPGDRDWPSVETWHRFNKTLGGKLIATVPEAAVCHTRGYADVGYNESACEYLQEEWNYPKIYEPVAGAIMNPFFQDGNCIPYTPQNQPCELGNLVSYSINVTSAADVVAGIHFTQEHNIRLVVKNTGHDYLGKSTGKGGLALWMHNLQTIDIIPEYTGYANYTGAAVKLGAGVTGGQTELAISGAGYSIVTGDCPTVGIAGGYSQGGGHGILNGAYGIAADNVLEWEVVTADGRHLVATPTQHQDLYWALSGGGGGTYGVTLSMVTRIHPDHDIVGDAQLSFNKTSAGSTSAYNSAIQAWFEFMPSLVDQHIVPLFDFSATGFSIPSNTVLNRTAQDLDTLYEPYRATLNSLNVSFDFSTKQWPNLFTQFNATQGPLPYGLYTSSSLFNSRFVPRAISESPDRAKNLTAAIVQSLDLADPEAAFGIGCNGMNVQQTPRADNGATPWWRESIAVCLTFSLYNWTIPWQQMHERRLWMTNVLTPMIEAATYDSGAYLNEAEALVYPDSDPGKWQNAFYGAHFERLRQIKDKYDPQGVFYAHTAVGSEDWTTDKDGRLCKT